MAPSFFLPQDIKIESLPYSPANFLRDFFINLITENKWNVSVQTQIQAFLQKQRRRGITTLRYMAASKDFLHVKEDFEKLPLGVQIALSQTLEQFPICL